MANSIKLVLLLGWCSLAGQTAPAKATLLWAEDAAPKTLQKGVTNYFNALQDSLPRRLWPLRIRNKLNSLGYWQAQVGFLEKDSSKLKITSGNFWQLAKLSIFVDDSVTVPQPLVATNPSALSQNNFENQLNTYLNFYQENGYPFVSAQLQSYAWHGKVLSGKVLIKPGPLVTWDSLSLKGFNTISPATLRYDLDFYTGKPYQESYLKKIETYARQVEFLSFTRAPAVGFFKNKTTLFLYTQEQKGNQIDGVIGLNTDQNGQTTLNGDFQLRLLNIFKKGEDFALRWQRPDASVQELQLAVNWPYLFKTPVWLSTGFELFRQDSSFVNTRFNALLKYRIARQSFVNGGIEYISSNALASTTDAESVFTSLNSFSTTTYLIGTEIVRLNRALVPTEGFQLEVYGKTGRRNTAQDNQNQLGWQAQGQWLWPFYSKMVLKIGLQSQAILGSNLFENELYRLGGLKTLRGFNEQSLFSSAYAIGTFEYRYHLGDFDYLTLFTDLAYSNRKIGNTNNFSWLNGLGTGINFRTNGGIFSLFLAVGQSSNSSLDFRATKVHFGYVNQF
jgi:hypothetical protein